MNATDHKVKQSERLLLRDSEYTRNGNRNDIDAQERNRNRNDIDNKEMEIAMKTTTTNFKNKEMEIAMKTTTTNFKNKSAQSQS